MESRYLTSAILPKRLSCSASRGPALVFDRVLSLRSQVKLDHLENDTLKYDTVIIPPGVRVTNDVFGVFASRRAGAGWPERSDRATDALQW